MPPNEVRDEQRNELLKEGNQLVWKEEIDWKDKLLGHLRYPKSPKAKISLRLRERTRIVPR